MVGGGRRAAWISGLYSPQPRCVTQSHSAPEEYICNSALVLSEAPIGWSFPQWADVGAGGAVVPRHNPHDCVYRVVCLGSTTQRHQGREANPAT